MTKLSKEAEMALIGALLINVNCDVKEELLDAGFLCETDEPLQISIHPDGENYLAGRPIVIVELPDDEWEGDEMDAANRFYDICEEYKPGEIGYVKL